MVEYFEEFLMKFRKEYNALACLRTHKVRCTVWGCADPEMKRATALEF